MKGIPGMNLRPIAIGIDNMEPHIAAWLVVFFQNKPNKKTAKIPGLTIPVYSCINWKA